MILLWRIMLHIFIVENAPAFARDFAEQEVFKLFAVAEKKPRLMPGYKARVGKPFLGKFYCWKCRHHWTAFSKQGCDPNIIVECPKCENETGSLI